MSAARGGGRRGSVVHLAARAGVAAGGDVVVVVRCCAHACVAMLGERGGEATIDRNHDGGDGDRRQEAEH